MEVMWDKMQWVKYHDILNSDTSYFALMSVGSADNVTMVNVGTQARPFNSLRPSDAYMRR